MSDNLIFAGAVMSCPQRSDTWPELRRRWPGWPIVSDDGAGLVVNFCRTLCTAADAGASWSVVAQDDALPTDHLIDDLPNVLSSVPSRGPISGYSMGWKADPAAILAGRRWVRKRRGKLLYTVFIAVPTELVDDLVQGIMEGDGPHDDERLSIWLDRARIPAYTHLPSLVQHAGVVSATGNGWTIMGRPRVSPTWDARWRP